MYKTSMALALAMGNLMGLGAQHAQVIERNSSLNTIDLQPRRGKGRKFSSRPSGAAAIKRASRKAHNIAKYARGSR